MTNQESPGKAYTKNVAQKSYEKPHQNMAYHSQNSVAPEQTKNYSNMVQPVGIKLMPNPQQKVGPSGAQLSEHICKVFIEAVKTGEPEKLNHEIVQNQVEVRDVQDSAHFQQNLIFTACQVTDEVKAIELVKLLVWHGVDFYQKDNLK
jgi:hypothetical protein